MHPLPPEIVYLLNDLARDNEIEESLPEAGRWVARALETLEAEAQAYVSDADESAVENARYLLERMLEDLGRAASLDPIGRTELANSLMAAAYDTAPLLQRVVRERTRVWFVDVAALDALIVAGVATLQGRGRSDAIRERLPDALAQVQALHADFLQRAPSLPGEPREALRRGYELVMDGLERLGAFLESGRAPELEAALASLKAGGHLVEVQARWGHACRPLTLSQELDDLAWAARAEEEGWRAQRERARRELLPRLRAVWRPAPERLALRLEAREHLGQEALAALEDLEAVLEGSDATGREVADAIDAFQGVTALLAREVLHPEAAPPEWRELATLVAGAWNGTVPDLVLARRATEVMAGPAPEEVQIAAWHLDEYLQGEERLHLLAALEALLAAPPS